MSSQTTSFKYFNSQLKEFQDTFVPDGNFILQTNQFLVNPSPIIAGQANDLWALAYDSTANSSSLFYFNGATWSNVNLGAISRYYARTFVWDAPNAQLLIYLTDFSQGSFIDKMIQVNPETSPTGSLMNYGMFSTYGYVAGYTEIQTDQGIGEAFLLSLFLLYFFFLISVEMLFQRSTLLVSLTMWERERLLRTLQSFLMENGSRCHFRQNLWEQ